MESISSTKMIAGACLRAVWNRSRTRAAPTPTNISMKSLPVTETNGTPASPATARAMRVLPVPGGPTSSTPLGMRAPICLNFWGFLRKSTTSEISALTAPYPATSSNVVLGFSVLYTFARLRPMFMTAPIWPCWRRLHQMKTPMISTIGKRKTRMSTMLVELERLYSRLTPRSLSRSTALFWKSLLGPELVKSLVPPTAVLNVPEMSPLEGSKTTLDTWPLSTSLMNCE